LRFIPGSFFPFGSSESEDELARGDELPQNEVRLPGFWMMGNEITNEDYLNCENAGVCKPPETSDEGPLSHYRNSKYLKYPVIGVSWYQAETFCKWIDGRIPTEAEWEKAARGEFGQIFPWGNESTDCRLLNIHGCAEEPGPVPVSSYPGGASPYGVDDMAGNVREWVFDWYAEDAYKHIALVNPSGPTEGKLKVVRGGGWKDFEENVRAAARSAYPPESTHEDVGFRCIPQVKSYAPFCPPEYTPLCRDPKIPPRDEPCIPGEGVPGDEGVTISNFGCPMNGQVTILFDTHSGGNEGYSASVNDESFNCQPSALGANLVECSGPEQRMGSTAIIIICKGGSPQNDGASTELSMQLESGFSLVNYLQNSPLLALQTIAGNCPDGYALNPETGACIRDDEDDCPPGWFVAAAVRCEPEDEDACPEGTKFNTNTGGCEPQEQECPEGYYLSKDNTCEPEQNREGLCPPGYYYNRKTECCQPLTGDNFGCEDGFYFNAKYQKCLPIDGYNCGYGMLYNGYDACLESPYMMEDPEPPPDGQCPPDLLTALAANTCEYPPDGYTETHPDPNRITRPGDLLDPNGRIIPRTNPNQPEDCGPNGLYLAALQNCFEPDENGCPPNYYWHEKYQRCVPTNGPGSGCPPGYYYHPKLECCVPAPGRQGTNCLNAEVAIIGDTGAQLPGAAGQDGTTPLEADGSGGGNVAAAGQYAITHFDPQQGVCDDDTTRNDEQPDCPPGYFTHNNPNCTYFDDLEETQGSPDGQPEGGFTANNCPPGYWDEKREECTYEQPECEPYEYFDYRLGYCVPLQDDCCPIGYDFSQNLKRCVPVEFNSGKHKPGEPCPEGYEDVQGRCLLIGRTEGRGLCWTISVNVPQCIGRCKIGYKWNEKTGRCEKPVDPCANVNCGSYGQQNCPSNCCTWDGKRCVLK
jgi:iron(II)-dependent oxidoreductase